MRFRRLMVPSNKYGIKCPYGMSPKGICLHNTWNDAPAINEASYMVGNNREVSFHYVVDNNEVVQCIEDNRNAWHCGASYGNRNLLAVETCYSRSGGARFTQAEKNAAKFIALKLKQYGWGVDKLYTHQQQSGKYCPHRTLDMGWQRFKNMVQAELNALNTPPAPRYKPQQPGNPAYADTRIKYRVHVENLGWLPWVRDGQTAGTTGNSLQIEAIQIDCDQKIRAFGHIQDVGTVDFGYITKDTVIGSTGQHRRLEALVLLCEGKTVLIRPHVPNKGWLGFSGVVTGTVGMKMRLEALQLKLQ